MSAPDYTNMSVDEWIAVADHPRQRDTEARANLASQKHLKELGDQHRIVFMAFWNGKHYKLDGHTRAYLWKHGRLDRPNHITAHIFYPTTEKQFNKHYESFDSRHAVKTVGEDVYGIFKEQNIHLTSGLLRRYTFASQLKLADGLRSGSLTPDIIYSLAVSWKSELLMLDSMNFNKKFSFLIALMLVMLREHGLEKVEEFFKAVHDDQGRKDSAGRDGIQKAIEYLAVKRASKSASGWENWHEIFHKMEAFFNQWLAAEKTPPKIPQKKRQTQSGVGQAPQPDSQSSTTS